MIDPFFAKIDDLSHPHGLVELTEEGVRLHFADGQVLDLPPLDHVLEDDAYALGAELKQHLNVASVGSQLQDDASLFDTGKAKVQLCCGHRRSPGNPQLKADIVNWLPPQDIVLYTDDKGIIHKLWVILVPSSDYTSKSLYEYVDNDAYP